jgi:hypothetical protein
MNRVNSSALFARKVVCQKDAVYLQLVNGFIVANLRMVLSKKAEW